MKHKTSSVGVVILSDLHVGSDVGLWPPSGELPSGNTVGFGKNAHQRWLWKVWGETVRIATEHFGDSKWDLILNGDLMEGIHHRTTEVVSPEEMSHAEAAVLCLKPLVSAASNTFVVRGTECHVKNFEKVIAEKLGATYCGDSLLLDIHGTLLEAKHHMPTTSRAYLEAGPLSVVMSNARLNSLRAGHKVPRVFTRGHRHTGGFYSDGECLMVVTGAYQLLTRHGKKVVGESISRPSFGVLDWRGRPRDSVPGVLLPTFNPYEEKIRR